MKNSIKKLLISICFIAFIYFIGGIIYTNIPRKQEKNIKLNDNVSIKGYEYVLLDSQTKLYKDEFKKLKLNLESENIDFKEYAISVSKLFLIDLYTLSNKKNMYDVTSQVFVYPDARDNYKLNVSNTIYKYMNDENSNKHNNELPVVNDISVISVEDNKFKIGENEYDGYKISIKIDYEKDLGYDKNAEVIVIKKDNYIYVVEKNDVVS